MRRIAWRLHRPLVAAALAAALLASAAARANEPASLTFTRNGNEIEFDWSAPVLAPGAARPLRYCVHYGFTYLDAEGHAEPEECIAATQTNYTVDLNQAVEGDRAGRTLTGVIFKVRAKYAGGMLSSWAWTLVDSL